MKITIQSTAKELAVLVLELQGRPVCHRTIRCEVNHQKILEDVLSEMRERESEERR